MSLHSRKNIPTYFSLFAIVGIAVFVILYLIAASRYPGGSAVDKHSLGFNWRENYWCNLLNETAINGQPNRARPVAIAGMIILCLSLSMFWLSLAPPLLGGKRERMVVRVCGVASMVGAGLLCADLSHDMVIDVASMLGIIASLVLLVALYRGKHFLLFYFGLANIMLVVMNSIFYYNPALIRYLAILQKLTFAALLVWFCAVAISIFVWERPKRTYE